MTVRRVTALHSPIFGRSDGSIPSELYDGSIGVGMENVDGRQTLF